MSPSQHNEFDLFLCLLPLSLGAPQRLRVLSVRYHSTCAWGSIFANLINRAKSRFCRKHSHGRAHWPCPTGLVVIRPIPRATLGRLCQPQASRPASRPPAPPRVLISESQGRCRSRRHPIPSSKLQLPLPPSPPPLEPLRPPHRRSAARTTHARRREAERRVLDADPTTQAQNRPTQSGEVRPACLLSLAPPTPSRLPPNWGARAL